MCVISNSEDLFFIRSGSIPDCVKGIKTLAALLKVAEHFIVFHKP